MYILKLKLNLKEIFIIKQASKNVSVFKPDELRLRQIWNWSLSTAHGNQLLESLSGDNQVYTTHIQTVISGNGDSTPICPLIAHSRKIFSFKFTLVAAS